LQVGKGKDKRIKIGEIEDKKIFCYKNQSSEKINTDKLKEVIEETIYKYARLEDENTNSGFVLINKRPSVSIYKETVREIVNIDETKKLLKSSKSYFKGYKNSRGIIGATASVAWSSKNDKTFELITYRQKEKWGSKRFVDDDSTMEMNKTCSLTFDNYDYENKHNRIVPSSPCPVLFGIRGENETELVKAKSMIKSEKIDAWIIFESNQGTDDHLQRKNIDKIKPYNSVIVKGKVSRKPLTLEGGHVIFSIKDSTGCIDCAAYEPTKKFRNIIRKLVVGDVVEVYGGIRKEPLTINIEKIKIISLKNLIEKVENPVCLKCGKHMKSKGKKQGFKCKICGSESNKPLLKEKKRLIQTGFYEVPVCARRHLSKPLKRIKKQS